MHLCYSLRSLIIATAVVAFAAASIRTIRFAVRPIPINVDSAGKQALSQLSATDSVKIERYSHERLEELDVQSLRRAAVRPERPNIGVARVVDIDDDEIGLGSVAARSSAQPDPSYQNEYKPLHQAHFQSLAEQLLSQRTTAERHVPVFAKVAAAAKTSH